MSDAKTYLVAGATGATGRLLVRQLLDRGMHVRALVRSSDRLPQDIKDHERVEVVETDLLSLKQEEIVNLVDGCHGVASCLGHNLSFRGMYGPPYRLVSDSVRALRDAMDSTGTTRFVLMSSSGVRDTETGESVSIAQRLVVGLIRLLVPPHADNEKAARVLQKSDRDANWVAVRPDGLVNHDRVTDYELHPSPVRSAIFDAGQTSRINVAHFMARLLTEDETWDQWKGRMPVIYNAFTENAG